jgi:hypothetical protein
MTTADLPSAIDRDREIFGGTRAPVLEWAFRTASGYAHVAGSPDAGYCFGRRGRLFDQIGPLVAGDAAVAHALVLEACAAANGRRSPWTRSTCTPHSPQVSASAGSPSSGRSSACPCAADLPNR